MGARYYVRAPLSLLPLSLSSRLSLPLLFISGYLLGFQSYDCAPNGCPSLVLLDKPYRYAMFETRVICAKLIQRIEYIMALSCAENSMGRTARVYICTADVNYYKLIDCLLNQMRILRFNWIRRYASIHHYCIESEYDRWCACERDGPLYYYIVALMKGATN